MVERCCCCRKRTTERNGSEWNGKERCCCCRCWKRTVNRNDGVVVFGRELRIGTEQLLLEQIVVGTNCCCCKRIGSKSNYVVVVAVIVVVGIESEANRCCCYGSELGIRTELLLALFFVGRETERCWCCRCRKRITVERCCCFVVGSELSCYFVVGRELRLLSKLLD